MKKLKKQECLLILIVFLAVIASSCATVRNKINDSNFKENQLVAITRNNEEGKNPGYYKEIPMPKIMFPTLKTRVGGDSDDKENLFKLLYGGTGVLIVELVINGHETDLRKAGYNPWLFRLPYVNFIADLMEKITSFKKPSWEVITGPDGGVGIGFRHEF
jgi:hypothetical protein